jgi:hypothetical protein
MAKDQKAEDREKWERKDTEETRREQARRQLTNRLDRLEKEFNDWTAKTLGSIESR